MLHNIGTVLLILGIIGHLAAFIFKENRALLPGMFTGYIDRNYAEHRHVLWCKKPESKEQVPSFTDEEPHGREQGRNETGHPGC